MIQGIPRRVFISSAKVAELVFEKIFPVVQGETTEAVVTSLICAAALAQRPNCSIEQLHKAVIETTSHLVMQLQDDPVEPSQVN